MSGHRRCCSCGVRWLPQTRTMQIPREIEWRYVFPCGRGVIEANYLRGAEAWVWNTFGEPQNFPPPEVGQSQGFFHTACFAAFDQVPFSYVQQAFRHYRGWGPAPAALPQAVREAFLAKFGVGYSEELYNAMGGDATLLGVGQLGGQPGVMFYKDGYDGTSTTFKAVPNKLYFVQYRPLPSAFNGLDAWLGACAHDFDSCDPNPSAWPRTVESNVQGDLVKLRYHALPFVATPPPDADPWWYEDVTDQSGQIQATLVIDGNYDLSSMASRDELLANAGSRFRSLSVGFYVAGVAIGTSANVEDRQARLFAEDNPLGAAFNFVGGGTYTHDFGAVAAGPAGLDFAAPVTWWHRQRDFPVNALQNYTYYGDPPGSCVVDHQFAYDWMVYWTPPGAFQYRYNWERAEEMAAAAQIRVELSALAVP